MRSIRNLWVGLLLFSVALLVCSCRLRPRVILYNNAGIQLTVLSAKNVCELPPCTQTEFIYRGNEKMMIIAGDVVWRYDVPPSRRVYYDDNVHIYAQIETNGTVYILSSTNEFPVSKENLKFQPEGFPLIPKELRQRE